MGLLGPFTIGKGEVDGDPMLVWGNLRNITAFRWNSKTTFYSEVVKGGQIKWKRIQQKGAIYPVEVNPNVDWNELVMSLQSMGITEWQGWILGDFAVNEAGIIYVQCFGVHTFFINDKIMTGDVYRRQEFWFPVFLEQGIHTLLVKLRAKGPTSFLCNVKAEDNSFHHHVHQPSFMPDLVEGKLFSHYISIPVSNLHASQWIKISKITLLKQTSGIPLSAKLHSSVANLKIAPGQIHPIIVEISYQQTDVHLNNPDSCNSVNIDLKLYFTQGKPRTLPVVLRCRKLKESFLFTFIDHDGSVQHGAVISPSSGCEAQSCPVLLTLHGTTVPPQNQVDSYKRMENKHWVFGVEGMWVAAPTRHGAHNWEGPGELTAMSALNSLVQLTNNKTWVTSQAASDLIVIAGHSMGGHGAWQLSTHNPDKTLAVISAAGWLKKEEYGDSNLFFRHDVASSHTDPVVKSIMEACTAENDADKHVSNLQGIPVLIRIGADDKTVHPYYSRRMNRLLKEQGVNVTYEEIKNKEHWWWDTFSTNDGGVTNDPTIRQFPLDHIHAYNQHSERATCRSQQDGTKKCEDKPTQNRYQSATDLSGRNLANGGQFELVVYNPATLNGVRGVRVLQQIVPFRKSTISISLSAQEVFLTTVNVQKISLTDHAVVFPVNWQLRVILVDGIEFTPEQFQDAGIKNPVVLCRHKKEKSTKWKLCEYQSLHFESETERGPENFGPARRVAEKPFLIVTGTFASSKVNELLLLQAVYLANLFYLTSDAYAPIVNDVNLTEEMAHHYNLIILGNPMQNSWTASFFNKVPLIFSEKEGFGLGECRFSLPQTGVLFLAPHAGNKLALVLSGLSLDGTHDIIQLATPTIPPMTRSPFSNMIPDFVITGPRFLSQGTGGYLCAGFWGNSWDYRQELASCTC